MCHDLAGSTQKRLHTRSEESIHWALRATFFWNFLHSKSRGSSIETGQLRSELQNRCFEFDPYRRFILQVPSWKSTVNILCQVNLSFAFCPTILRYRIVTNSVWTCNPPFTSWRAWRPTWPLRPTTIYRLIERQMRVRLRARDTLFMVTCFSSSTSSSICPRLMPCRTKFRSVSCSCLAPELWAARAAWAACTIVTEDYKLLSKDHQIFKFPLFGSCQSDPSSLIMKWYSYLVCIEHPVIYESCQCRGKCVAGSKLDFALKTPESYASCSFLVLDWWGRRSFAMSISTTSKDRSSFLMDKGRQSPWYLLLLRSPWKKHVIARL